MNLNRSGEAAATSIARSQNTAKRMPIPPHELNCLLCVFSTCRFARISEVCCETG